MMDDRKPDDPYNIKVDGYNVVAYSFGTGSEVLFCLNGGPGLPCDYVRDSHSWLSDNDYRVVAFDQLGCGSSDRPDDESLWTIQRYVKEVETVRTELELGTVHLYGQSWGTWLGIEYALTYPESFKTIILADGAGDIPHLVNELKSKRSEIDDQLQKVFPPISLERFSEKGTNF